MEHRVYSVSSVFLLFIVLFFFGIRYAISGEKLYLEIWFIPIRSANIADIVSIRRSYNPLSAPAASFKRLFIQFISGSFGWLISPVREKEFIEALKTINPGIEVSISEKTGKRSIWDWDI